MIFADAVLTDEYAAMIVNETPIFEETKNVEKSEHKQCFETDMVEVVLVGMEFLDSMHLLNDTYIWILGTVTSVHTYIPCCTNMEWFRKRRPRRMEASLSVMELIVRTLQCKETLLEPCAIKNWN
jgi:hypothetical protein